MDTVVTATATADNSGSLSDDDQMVVLAAYAAADALSENDKAVTTIGGHSHQQAASTHVNGVEEAPAVCLICGQGGSKDTHATASSSTTPKAADTRPILRFLPVHHDPSAARAAPGVTTFRQDICLHIFCGKTASILPHVQRPDLEILTKAGLKNKHGIGPEVNAALARTRCAIVVQLDGSTSSSSSSSKEKSYYLVREFEAHLASIRHTHLAFDPFPDAAVRMGNAAGMPRLSTVVPSEAPENDGNGDTPTALDDDEAVRLAAVATEQGAVPSSPDDGVVLPSYYETDFVAAFQGQSSTTSTPTSTPGGRYNSHSRTSSSTRKRKAAHHGSDHSPHHLRHADDDDDDPQISLMSSPHEEQPPEEEEVLADGRVRCGCGGTHWPTTTARGMHSWRSHATSKRHQKWMEDQGLLGTVLL